MEVALRILHGYFEPMALKNLAVAEEALSLSPSDRRVVVQLLIQSVEGDRQTDDEITAELGRRLEALKSGQDAGLTFEQVFGTLA